MKLARASPDGYVRLNLYQDPVLVLHQNLVNVVWWSGYP